jgi:two-component system, NtrC family, C4-dicarboxylate transport sensor histidine kinase DctB
VGSLLAESDVYPVSWHPDHSTAAETAALQERIDALEGERERLWSWIFHLERLGQAGLMAGGLAHDARNFLTGIAATCQTALIKDDPDGMRTTLAQADVLARRAAEMMSVFLAFASRSSKSSTSCRIEAVLDDVQRFGAATLGRSQVKFERRVAPDVAVVGERTLLLQALLNLVLNSVKAIGDQPGHILVAARREGDRVVLEVTDDGPGIPETIRVSLFAPFVTSGPGAADTPGAAVGGTGLGLFLTKKIIEQLGGTIEVETRARVGTTFRLRLAAAPAAVSAARPPVAA